MRQRLIRPGFFSNEFLGVLPPLTRILFAGLWCCADREGRLEDRPLRIKANVLPYDAYDVDAGLNELQASGFILRYEVDGERYIEIVKFSKNQWPHHKEQESVIPKPRANPGQAQGKTKASPKVAHPLTGSTGPTGPTGSTVNSLSATVVAVPVASQAPSGIWSREACDDWISRFGGTAPGGPIGKALKPLVQRYGWESVRAAWRNYLQQAEAEFASAARFASTYGRWEGTASPGGRQTAGNRLMLEAQAAVEHIRARKASGGEG